ncbi:MAG: hypothetical protein M1331_02220 [Candidatus Marsarchaeota archaeon]|nr:hypothetical protein [Candidatus Marsarchaeota archaeon]
MAVNAGKENRRHADAKANNTNKDASRNNKANKKLVKVEYEVLRNHLLDISGAPEIDSYISGSKNDAEARYKYCETKSNLFSFARLDKVEYYINGKGKISSVRKQLKGFKREIERR